MVSTSSSAGWPAASIAVADLGDPARDAGGGLVVHDGHGADRVAPVGGEALVDDLGVGAVAPVALDPVDLQTEPLGHRAPQRREVAGLEGEHAVAGRERVDQRRLPRAGARRREDDDGAAGLEDRPSPSSTSWPSAAKSGPRWSIVGASMARRTRSGTFVGPGICRKWRPLRRPRGSWRLLCRGCEAGQRSVYPSGRSGKRAEGGGPTLAARLEVDATRSLTGAHDPSAAALEAALQRELRGEVRRRRLLAPPVRDRREHVRRRAARWSPSRATPRRRRRHRASPAATACRSSLAAPARASSGQTIGAGGVVSTPRAT